MLTRSAVIETLRKSNRLLDVKRIIWNIGESTEMSSGQYLPVHFCISNDGKIITHVKGENIYSESRHLFEVLSTPGCMDDPNEASVDVYIHEDDFDNLSLYVTDHCDVLLHNYAVSVSHRIDEEMDDDIRVWCILANLLDNLHSDTWDVPVGWMRSDS